MSDGDLTPTEGASVMGLVETFRRTLELTEIETRLTAKEMAEARWCQIAPPIEVAAAAMADLGWETSGNELWARIGRLAGDGGAAGSFFARLETAHNAAMLDGPREIENVH